MANGGEERRKSVRKKKKFTHPYPLTIRCQGRVTIPYEVRETLDLKTGDRIYITLWRAEEKPSAIEL